MGTESIEFPSNANTLEYARSQDAADPIRHLRDQFILPTKASMRKKALDGKLPAYPPNLTKPAGTSGQESYNGIANGTANGSTNHGTDDSTPAVYFCGNSLGLQPKAVRAYLDAQLETWASVGVHGHFSSLANSPLASWQDMAAECAQKSAHIVGAAPEEVVIMNTLTVNLHLMMASFYKPTPTRHKIIAEWKPFPSDTYAINSQIEWHGLDPAASLVELQPDEHFYLSTDHILRTMDAHASSTALLLLPGIQYWSGQLFDMARITAHARSLGIVVGWDLAHAVGNVPLRLHDWGVDFAVWCTYKYLNAGPGAIAGAFVHSRHGAVGPLDPTASYSSSSSSLSSPSSSIPKFRHRLAGWYGGDKSVRFDMAKEFRPTPGAQGWVLSNPSAVDLASLGAALSVFAMTSMEGLRAKSLRLTAYAERLLLDLLREDGARGGNGSGDGGAKAAPAFRIITPASKDERGAQLSVLLREGLLEKVGERMEEAGVVCDRRKPDVIRVAPVPMYNTFEDVWRCADALRRAVLD